LVSKSSGSTSPSTSPDLQKNAKALATVSALRRGSCNGATMQRF
jgi:hypothetical protein